VNAIISHTCSSSISISSSSSSTGGGDKSISIKKTSSHIVKTHRRNLLDTKSHLMAGGDSHLKSFRERMEEIAKDKEHHVVPFELRTFECILSLAADNVQHDLEKVLPMVEKIREHTMNESNRVALEFLRDYREQTLRLRLRAMAMRTTLETFLQDDRDMSMIQFSAILADPSRFENGEPDEEWISHHDEVGRAAYTVLLLVNIF